LIVHSSSEGAQISKLIVNYILIPSSEGARRAALKLIVDFVVHHELIELINGFVSHIELTELISRVLDGHMNYFQQGAASHFNDACIHRLIVVSVSEGALQVAPAQLAASSTILKLIDALISEGARLDSNLYRPGDLDSSQLTVYIIYAKRASQLIVIYSKKFLHFREDCVSSCEGEWEEQSQQPKHDLVDHYGVIGRANLIDLIKFVKCNGLVDFIGVVGFVGLDRLVGIVGLSCLDDIIGLVDLVKIGISIVSQEVGLVGLVNLSLVGHSGFGLVGYTGLGLDGSSLIDRISLVGPMIGFSGISGLANQISLISLSDLAMISLVGSLASFVCLIISLIGVIGLSLIASLASVASLARRLISFISLVGSSHRLFCERLATAVNEATKITWRLKQAAALGVATVFIILSPRCFTCIRS
jgi:hypothetical protein